MYCVSAIKEINQGVSAVSKREMTDKLSSYRDMINADFEKRIVLYEEAKKALAERSENQNQVTLEQPLPANKVDPYAADAFDMGTAARDYRFEMIKLYEGETMPQPTQRRPSIRTAAGAIRAPTSSDCCCL